MCVCVLICVGGARGVFALVGRDKPGGESDSVLFCESRSVVSNSLGSHGLYSPWNSPGQNTGVGSLSLLQGSNPGIEPLSPSLTVDSLPAEPLTSEDKAVSEMCWSLGFVA